MFRCLIFDARLQSREQPPAEASIPVRPDVFVGDPVEVFEDDNGILELGRVFDGPGRSLLDFIFGGVLPPPPHEVVQEVRGLAWLQAVFGRGLFLSEVSDAATIHEQRVNGHVVS